MMAAGQLAVGLISGTSMDGIDVCVIKVQSANETHHNHSDIEVLGYMTHPYPDGLCEQLLCICNEGCVQDVCLYNVLIGELFAEAVHVMLAKLNLTYKDILVIGSHGQTIYHIPDTVEMYGHYVQGTLQLGDPSIIANYCGITTVGDFRLADMAVKGQGAPLVPYLDCLLTRSHYAKTGRLSVFLNIGGISNIFTNGSDINNDEHCIGFDCGPGNILIDGLMKRLYQVNFDNNGDIAAQGNVQQHLLEWLMEDTVVLKSPPKSTGREHYNTKYLERIVQKCNESRMTYPNCIATITAFTACSIWYNFDKYVRHLLEGEESKVDLFVSGGGAKNSTLMKYLTDYFQPIKVRSTEDIGIPIDAKEAICFALLGYETIHGRTTNISAVTGAKSKVILGKVCLVSDKCVTTSKNIK